MKYEENKLGASIKISSESIDASKWLRPSIFLSRQLRWLEMKADLTRKGDASSGFLSICLDSGLLIF